MILFLNTKGFLHPPLICIKGSMWWNWAAYKLEIELIWNIHHGRAVLFPLWPRTEGKAGTTQRGVCPAPPAVVSPAETSPGRAPKVMPSSLLTLPKGKPLQTHSSASWKTDEPENLFSVLLLLLVVVLFSFLMPSFPGSLVEPFLQSCDGSCW